MYFDRALAASVALDDDGLKRALPQQVRQLGNLDRDPPRLVLGWPPIAAPALEIE
jgi:hypothetical protein